MRYYLAVDIGASSGRHIVGWQENGEILTSEVYRFPNKMEKTDGHLTWNTEMLMTHIRTGICEDPAVKDNIDRRHKAKLHKLQLMPKYIPAGD